MKATKVTGNKKDGFSVFITAGKVNVWVDVYISSNDVITDWNKYIFHLNDPEDQAIKEFQESTDNFDEASSLAIAALEDQGYIKQDSKGNWIYN